MKTLNTQEQESELDIQDIEVSIPATPNIIERQIQASKTKPTVSYHHNKNVSLSTLDIETVLSDEQIPKLYKS